MLGPRVRLTGVVAQAAIAALRRFWVGGGPDYHEVMTNLVGGRPEDCPERWDQASPAALLPLGVPQVLVHGIADDTVPVELIELPKADHFTLLFPDLKPWEPTLAAVEGLFARRADCGAR